jgi:hypothetical protein
MQPFLRLVRDARAFAHQHSAVRCRGLDRGTRSETRGAGCEAAARRGAHVDRLAHHRPGGADEPGCSGAGAERDNISATEFLFVHQLRELQRALQQSTRFYETGSLTYAECHARLTYLKDVIENKGGHRLFYHNGVPIEREQDLQILYRLVWFGTPSDVSREVNDGRGPVDFKVSRGARDKTLVEMKLAKNSHLERNLEKQVRIYQAASDAERGIKAIIFFTQAEQHRAKGILDKLGLLGHKDIVLIDARDDNKPSGSKA